MSYDGIGNITSKSDAGGGYVYHSGTHRVATAGGKNYAYGPSGMLTQVTTSQGQLDVEIIPTPFLLPRSIRKTGGEWLIYNYDGSRRRVAETRTYSEPSTTIHVLNGDSPYFEEDITSGGAENSVSSWDFVSSVFARNAQGSARVVVNGTPSPTSTWARIEQPILNARSIPYQTIQYPR